MTREASHLYGLLHYVLCRCITLKTPPKLLMRWKSILTTVSHANDSSSELQSCLKRDHSRAAIATQADAQQAGWRRSCVCERSKACLRGRLSWNARQHHARKPKVRMVEDIEELGF